MSLNVNEWYNLLARLTMLVLVGTMPSLTSLVSFGNLSVVGTSGSSSSSSNCYSSYSLVRRVSLSKRSFRYTRATTTTKTWVCRYSVTATTTSTKADLITGNVSLDRANGSGNVDDDGVVLKPAPRPVMMSSPPTFSATSSSDDDGEERSKVIESLDEVLEKAQKLETGKQVVQTANVDNAVGNGVGNQKPPSSNGTRKTKTLKSVWRKGDNVASIQKVVKEAPKSNSSRNEEPRTVGGATKVESSTPPPPMPARPPLRPQPKLQAKPSVAPPPMIKKPVVLKDVGAAPKSSVTEEKDLGKERKPILIDKFATKKKAAVDPLIAQSVLAPTKPGKGPAPGKFKDDYRSRKVSAGGPRRRMVDDDDAEIVDDELNVSIPGAARKRKWNKASRKAAKLRAAQEAAPVKVEILEVEEKGMLIEELAYNLTVSEGEILGYLYSKGIKPDGVQTLDKDIVKMICKEYDVEVLDVDPVKMEEMARKKEIFDEEDLDKLEERPPVLTIMGHVDHGKANSLILFTINLS